MIPLIFLLEFQFRVCQFSVIIFCAYSAHTGLLVKSVQGPPKTHIHLGFILVIGKLQLLPCQCL